MEGEVKKASCFRSNR